MREVTMMKHATSMLVLLFIILAGGLAWGDESPKSMTKEQLRPLLGKPDVVVIDLRTKYDWDNSKVKIKGAVREEGMKVGSWMTKYPKDKTIVLYCA
jgi:rhodanese-related sulfurtransferase